MNEVAYKFVNWEVPKLEELINSRVYQLKLKVINKEKLSREEKNFITKRVNNNSYSKRGIPLHGWMFGFSNILSTFLVKQYGTWTEYNAVDKTSLREMLYGRIDKIIKYK